MAIDSAGSAHASRVDEGSALASGTGLVPVMLHCSGCCGDETGDVANAFAGCGAAVPLEVAGYRHSLVASRRTCGRDLLRPRDTATRWLCPLRLRGHNWQLKQANAEGKWQKSVGGQLLFVRRTATAVAATRSRRIILNNFRQRPPNL